jgi:uncharacterized protein YecT (DUF1311 family)
MIIPVLLLAAFGSSQQGAKTKKNATNPCKDTTQADLHQCSAELFHQADSRLNALCRKITGSLQKQLDEAQMNNHADETKHFETSLKMLEEANGAWIAYRDLQCKAAMQLEEGGSIAPMEHAQCMLHVTEHRIDELRYSYQLVH